MDIDLMYRFVLGPAVRAVGSYDPDDVMPYIEERLTQQEYNIIFNFMLWVFENKKTFGSGNFMEVFHEWLTTVD